MQQEVGYAGIADGAFAGQAINISTSTPVRLEKRLKTVKEEETPAEPKPNRAQSDGSRALRQLWFEDRMEDT